MAAQVLDLIHNYFSMIYILYLIVIVSRKWTTTFGNGWEEKLSELQKTPRMGVFKNREGAGTSGDIHEYIGLVVWAHECHKLGGADFLIVLKSLLGQEEIRGLVFSLAIYSVICSPPESLQVLFQQWKVRKERNPLL